MVDKTEHELHEACINVIDGLMKLNPPKDSPFGRLLENMAIAVEAYEAEVYPLPEPTEEEARAFRADQEIGLSKSQARRLAAQRQKKP